MSTAAAGTMRSDAVGFFLIGLLGQDMSMDNIPGHDSFAKVATFGSLILLPANGIAAYYAGSMKGLRDAELYGYCFGSVAIVLAVLAIAAVFKAARCQSAVAKISFITLAICLLGNVANIAKPGEQSNPAVARPDLPPSLQINEEEIAKISGRIERALSHTDLVEVTKLANAERFKSRILRSINDPTRMNADFATGAAEAFSRATFLTQILPEIKQGAKVHFVKYYQRDGSPILQFRIVGDSGILIYLDFYLFKDATRITFDDVQYFNAGARMSVELAHIAQNEDVDPSSMDQDTQALEKMRAGKLKEAASMLDTLPAKVAELQMVQRQKIVVQLQLDPRRAEVLLRDYARKYPDDPSALFSSLLLAISGDDVPRVSTLVDKINAAVQGDSYLYWFKANFLALHGKFHEACR